MFFTIDSKQLVHRLLIIGGNSAGPRVKSFACQIEILADVTGIKQDNPVGSLQITPFHAVGHGCPDKHHGAVGDKTLTKDSATQSFFKIVIGSIYLDKFMGKWQIAIQSRRYCLHLIDKQIRLKTVSGPS